MVQFILFEQIVESHRMRDKNAHETTSVELSTILKKIVAASCTVSVRLLHEGGHVEVINNHIRHSYPYLQNLLNVNLATDIRCNRKLVTSVCVGLFGFGRRGVKGNCTSGIPSHKP